MKIEITVENGWLFIKQSKNEIGVPYECAQELIQSIQDIVDLAKETKASS